MITLSDKNYGFIEIFKEAEEKAEFLSADKDKDEALPLVKRFYSLGFNIEATAGQLDDGHVIEELVHGDPELVNQIETKILDVGPAPVAEDLTALANVKCQTAVVRKAIQNLIETFKKVEEPENEELI